MKRITVLLLLIIFTIWLIAYGYVNVNGQNPIDNTEKASAAPSVTPENDEGSPYRISENGGKIIIEHDGLITVTEISVAAMREADKKLLKDGIEVRTKEEALMILEDFES